MQLKNPENRFLDLWHPSDKSVPKKVGELRQLFYHRYAVVYVLEYQANFQFGWNDQLGYLYEDDDKSILCPIVSDEDHELFINVTKKVVVKRTKHNIKKNI